MDSPEEFRVRRDGIAEKLFSGLLARCPSCDRVESAVPAKEEEDSAYGNDFRAGSADDGQEDGRMNNNLDVHGVVSQLSSYSYDEVEALTKKRGQNNRFRRICGSRIVSLGSTLPNGIATEETKDKPGSRESHVDPRLVFSILRKLELVLGKIHRIRFPDILNSLVKTVTGSLITALESFARARRSDDCGSGSAEAAGGVISPAEIADVDVRFGIRDRKGDDID